MPIGPALPPHLAHLSASGASADAGPSTRSTTPPIPESDSDGDNYGPALPPHLAAKRAAGPSFSSSSTPTAPPPSRQQYDDEDESDDDIGPKPPGDNGGEAVPEKSAVEEFLEREKRRAERIEEESKPKVLKREEWMLVPPEAGILASVDPLRKRPTTFSRNAKEVVVDNTVWTETPAQKHQRMADEAAGVRRHKDPVRGEKDQSFETKGKRQRDEELKAQVERHSKSSRGESLLDQYQKKGQAKEDERGIWDHERDMGITGRLMSDKERQQKINEAKGLNDRFGHGKAGAFNM